MKNHPFSDSEIKSSSAGKFLCEEMKGRFKGLASLCHNASSQIEFNTAGLQVTEQICRLINTRLQGILDDLIELKAGPPIKVNITEETIDGMPEAASTTSKI